MQTVLKVTAGMVFVCLLSLAGGGAGYRHAPGRDIPASGQHRSVAVRSRRTRKSDPARHPACPRTRAALSSADDDDEEINRSRLENEDSRGAFLAVPAAPAVGRAFHRSPRANVPNQPLYQTFGVFLI